MKRVHGDIPTLAPGTPAEMLQPLYHQARQMADIITFLWLEHGVHSGHTFTEPGVSCSGCLLLSTLREENNLAIATNIRAQKHNIKTHDELHSTKISII